MKGLFWLLLVFTLPAGTESIENCSSQPHKVIWHKTGQSAVLPCYIDSHCSTENLNYHWFVFKKDSHVTLTLTSRHSLHEASLHIESLNVNDSGIYLCAVEPKDATNCCNQHVGLGMTLVVNEQVNFVLWLSSVLLAIYSLTLVALMILKKKGHNICKKAHKMETNSVRKQSQFRDVLQELHSRRNFNKNKQTTRANRPHAEAASVDNISTDDVYQNV